MIIESIIYTFIVVAERIAARLVTILPSDAAEHVLTIVGSYGIPFVQFLMHWFTPNAIAAMLATFMFAVSVWGTIYILEFIKLVKSWIL